MGDGDYRASSSQLGERILKDSACNGKALLLPAGEQASLIANNCLVVLWLRHDEIVGISGFGGLVNFFRCSVQAAELDIVENGIVKQERLLGDEPHLLA